MNTFFFKLTIISTLVCSHFTAKHEPSHECGRPLGTEFVFQSDRIVAGYNVGYYRYPWYAALIRFKQVSCGGALIGPRTVLTAAHCYKEYLNNSHSGLKLEDVYTVRLGMYNICTTESTVTEFEIEKVQVHEMYAKEKPYFDICILTLANSTDQYHPICLPSTDIKTRPKEGTVPGMGTLKYEGAMPCTLHEARLLIYPDSDCKNMINSTGNDAGAVQNAFCAGYMNGGIDTCQGDSGGPFQIIDENGNFILLGIVSFGFHCALPHYLGMYTDVSKYMDWIEEKSGLDASIVHNKSSVKNTTPQQSNDHQKKIKHFQHEHSHKAPIRIIILRNRQPLSKVKPILHIPIKRNHYNGHLHHNTN